MKTAYGVYYNLRESEWTCEIDGVLFVFSSEFYLRNFENEYRSEIIRFNEALNKVYKNKFYIEMDLLALIRLYVLIEKRGFYLIVEGNEVSCLEDLAFVGTVLSKNKSVN